ncbi:hypothetical protein ROHU_016184 [Labeo rohita]|uniref:Uncharacterized protein n=1 Tax=Labeo rohita TaxID=84645 RepID=A0A498NL01_LABRO|nr:hypothetical protein ROHU_016184 [Labeo rohita]
MKIVARAVRCKDATPDPDPRVPPPAGSCNSFHVSSHLRCFYVQIRSAFGLLSHGFDWSDASSGVPVCVEWQSNEALSLGCAVSPSRRGPARRSSPLSGKLCSVFPLLSVRMRHCVGTEKSA